MHSCIGNPPKKVVSFKKQYELKPKEGSLGNPLVLQIVCGSSFFLSCLDGMRGSRMVTDDRLVFQLNKYY